MKANEEVNLAGVVRRRWKSNAVPFVECPNPAGVANLEDAIAGKTASVERVSRTCFIVRIAEAGDKASENLDDGGAGIVAHTIWTNAHRVEGEVGGILRLEQHGTGDNGLRVATNVERNGIAQVPRFSECPLSIRDGFKSRAPVLN